MQVGKPARRNKWVHLDALGKVQAVAVDKHELVAQLGIRYRDLRSVDPWVPTPYPSAIFIREKALVVNLEGIRMIICADQVFVITAQVAGAFSDRATPPRPGSTFVQQLAAVLRARTYAERIEQTELHTQGSTPGAQHSVFTKQAEGVNSADARLPTEDPFDSTGEVEQLPYELRALDTALQCALGGLGAEVAALERTLDPALFRLAQGVSRKWLELVRNKKAELTNLLNRVERIKEKLETILDDDDDMRDMYLSRNIRRVPPLQTYASIQTSSLFRHIEEQPDGHHPDATQRHVPFATAHFARTDEHQEGGHDPMDLGLTRRMRGTVDPHEIEHCEDMLESYFMDADSLFRRLVKIKEAVDDTEDLVNVELDQRRNELVALNLIVAALGSMFTFGSMVSGVFGQNLGNTAWADSWLAFGVATSGAVVGGFLIFLGVVMYARKRRLF